jgi:hypothetical protein
MSEAIFACLIKQQVAIFQREKSVEFWAKYYFHAHICHNIWIFYWKTPLAHIFAKDAEICEFVPIGSHWLSLTTRANAFIVEKFWFNTAFARSWAIGFNEAIASSNLSLILTIGTKVIILHSVWHLIGVPSPLHRYIFAHAGSKGRASGIEWL